MRLYELVTNCTTQRGDAIANQAIQTFAQRWIKEESDEGPQTHVIDGMLLFAAETAPLFCLDVIAAICQLTDNHELLSQLGIGPLEALLSCGDADVEACIEAFHQYHPHFCFAMRQCVLLRSEAGFEWFRKWNSVG